MQISEITNQHSRTILERLKIVNTESITTKQASKYLSDIKGIPTAASSLEVYRCTGRGPKYKKIGRRILYTLAWLDQYAAGIEVKIYDPSKVQGAV